MRLERAVGVSHHGTCPKGHPRVIASVGKARYLRFGLCGMATSSTKPDIELSNTVKGMSAPQWPTAPADTGSGPLTTGGDPHQPAHLNALQALLAFSALHDQIRRRKALAARHNGFDSKSPVAEFEAEEQFVLDEVLQLVAERAVAITGADGLAIALAENDEIVLRASAGMVRPDVGARIDRDSAFSGACFRTAQIFTCDDTETDPRVNIDACRKLGARAMVAVPLCGRKRVIGVLEAFSTWPFSFNDSDVRNLSLLAELILAALKPDDEDRFAQSAQVAAKKLEPSKPPAPVASLVPAPASAVPQGLSAASATEPTKPITAAVSTATARPTPAQPVTAAAIPVSTVPLAAPASAPVASAKPQPAASANVTTAAKPLIPPAQAPGTPQPAAKAEVNKAGAPAATKSEVKAAEPVAATKAEIKPADLAPSAKPELKPTEAQAPAVAVAATGSPLAASPAEPQPSLPRPAVLSDRPWALIALVGIVVLSAFAGGVWWKIKTAQIGSVMVQSKPTLAQPISGAADKSANPAPLTNSTDGSATGTSAETISDATAPGNSPAAPQELSKFPRVTGLRHWSSADSSTVVLDLEDQVQYEPGHLTNPDRYYFDVRDTQLASELEGKSFDGDALLSHIRVAQPVSGMTRVVLEARPTTTLSRPQVSLERDPYRLVIVVSKAGATPKAEVNLFPNAAEADKNKLAIVVPAPTREDLQLRARVPKMRIVVDAGHGGWDLGTVGRRGLLEKDLVLEIADRLGKLLESRLGATVLYTRQDDNYIPLDSRAEIANQAQADLFVSVHANYSDLPSARGVETYYSNFFSAPGSKDTNAKDPKNPPLTAVASNNLTPTLTSAELHARVEQSRRLAASVQRSLYGALSIQNPGLRDRGIKEAGFVVLSETAMPGILAEVSFVSSPTDEQKLRSDGYREQIAEALYRGIARYAAASKGVKLASASK
jgi:N-acetylmuramoyl-L-alanine amidase/putative methionine-R-sulfoxide reductase with GAF domain